MYPVPPACFPDFAAECLLLLHSSSIRFVPVPAVHFPDQSERQLHLVLFPVAFVLFPALLSHCLIPTGHLPVPVPFLKTVRQSHPVLSGSWHPVFPD